MTDKPLANLMPAQTRQCVHSRFSESGQPVICKDCDAAPERQPETDDG